MLASEHIRVLGLLLGAYVKAERWKSASLSQPVLTEDVEGI